MSKADDILFEPISPQIPAWLKQTRDVKFYIETVGSRLKPMAAAYPMDRTRPDGSLTLEQMMTLYHVNGQDRFFVVKCNRNIKLMESFPFDGSINMMLYEHGKAPRLGTYNDLSIRDMNLVPNTYTRHYVFANENEARQYMKSL